MEIRSIYDDVKKLCERAVIRGFLSDQDVMSQIGLKADSSTPEKMIMDCTAEHHEWRKADTLSTEGYITSAMMEFVEEYLVNRYPSLYFHPMTVNKIRDKQNAGQFDKACAHETARSKRIQEIDITPRRIWQTSGGYTTIEWMDGEKTTVKAENEETATEFAGFCAALAKQIFGSTSNVDRKIQYAKWRTEEPARKKAEERKRIKMRKQREHQRRMRERENAIQDEMRRMQIEREAEKRLEKEE